jgi:hypothetical protein
MGESMRIQLDAEFWVSIGLFSRIGELSNLQLVKIYENSETEIRRATRHKRLKESTRKRKISDAASNQRACFSELSRRIWQQADKDFVDRLRKRNDASN